MEKLIIILISLCLGIYSGHKLSLIGTCFALVLACLINLFWKLYGDKKIKSANSIGEFFLKNYIFIELIIIIIVFLIGFVRIKQIDTYKNKKAEELLYKSCEFEGTIVEADERTLNYRVTIKLDKLNEKIEMYLSREQFSDVYPGDKVKLKGLLTPIKENSNLGMYNDKQNKNEKGIFYEFSGSCTNYERKNNDLLSFLTRLRRLICKVFDRTMNEKSSSLLKAMIIGETQFLNNDFKELFKEGGVAHILAISGLHVSLIAGIVSRILSLFKLSDKTKILISISILIFYAVLTGLSVSTVRALLMILFSEFGKLWRGDYDSRNGPYIAALVMLLIKPIWLFSLGFILSFASIMAIRCKLPLTKFKGQAVNLSVFLFNLPILAYNFYTLSGLSMVANILIVPLAEMLVGLSFAILLSYFVNVNVSIICGKIVEMIVHYFENILTMLSSFKGFNFVTGKISIWTVVLCYLTYLMLYRILKTKKIGKADYSEMKKKYLALLAAGLLIVLTIIPRGKNYHVTFIDVEHGDSCLIWNDKKDECIIIDGGGKGNSDKDVGTYNVYPYIKYLGIRKINYAFVTHTDRDHIKGIIELCRLMKIENVIFPDTNLTGPLYENLIKTCKDNNINISYMKQGDELSLGNINMKCIYPYADIRKYNFETNNSSLVLLTNIYNRKLIFTGDIEEEAENLIVNSGDDIKADILKVPHHGSKTSSTNLFISKVNPSFTIVSGDYSNMKTFNSIQKWKFKNSTVLSTYYNGMIDFTFKEA